MLDLPRSIPDVCEVTWVRGRRAAEGAAPSLLLEVAHGATRSSHFTNLRAALRGTFPDDLQAFFFVNTDVGAPEVAQRIAERVVEQDPTRSALVVRCLVPRTFVDCNRVIAPDAKPQGSAAGAVTPGLHAWVKDEADQRLLLARYAGYRATVTSAFAAVCGHGGLALMVHSYAPRSIDVPIDDRIVASLRAAYQPDKIGSWPLRAEVDFIVDDPEGKRLASSALADAAQQAFVAAGLQVARNGAYAIHPITLAHEFAVRYPEATLCLELRRDLLVPAFTPFAEMIPEPAKVARMAEPLVLAVAAVLATRA